MYIEQILENALHFEELATACFIFMLYYIKQRELSIKRNFIVRNILSPAKHTRL